MGGIANLGSAVWALLSRISTPLLALAFAFGVVLVAVAPGAASAGTMVNVGGASAQAGQMASSTVSVSLSGSDTMNGFDVTVTFDPSIAHVASVAIAAGWSQPPLIKTVDNTTGSVRIAAFQLGTGCAAGTSCPLFSISWQTLSAGISSVHISSQQLGGNNGGSVGFLTNVNTSDGVLTVNGPTSPGTPATATNTPVPSPTATRVPATATPMTVPPTATAVIPAPVNSPAVQSPTVAPSSDPPSGAVVPVDSPPPAVVAGAEGTSVPPQAVPPIVPVPATVQTAAVATPTAQTQTQPSSVGASATPRPPSTGNGSSAAGVPDVRIAGMALMVLSALALVGRGIGVARHGGTVRAVRRESLTPRELSTDFVTRFLADAEAQAHLDAWTSRDDRDTP
jgi:hypothetical protein